MVAPKSKLMWRRKEVQPPMVVSIQAGQAGGCGEVGKQDLKMAKTREDFVDITPPFQDDPHALGTTLFEGGEDDMGKDARGRSGRKAQEEIIKKEGSVRTDRSPEIETDVDSSYELQIKQISTCLKHHSESFPTSTYMSPGGG